MMFGSKDGSLRARRLAAALLVASMIVTVFPMIAQDARAEPTTIMTASFTDGALGPFSQGQNQRQVSSAYYHSASYSMEVKGGSTMGAGAAAALLEGTNRELTIEFWAMFRGAFTQSVVPTVVTWLGEAEWDYRALSLLLLNGNSNGTAWIMLPNQAGEVYNDNGGTVATNTLISLNTWYHFSFVLAADRTSLALSLDYTPIGTCPLVPESAIDPMYSIGSIAYYQDSLSGDKSMFVDDIWVTADGDPYDPPRWAPSLIAADTPLWVELGQEYSFSLEYNESVTVRLDWVALDAFVGGLTEPERDAYYALYDALTWTNWVEDATTVSSHALIDSELITTIPFWMVATSTAGTGQIYTNWTVTVGEEPEPQPWASSWTTTPGTSAQVGSEYSYTPLINETGDISVVSKPSWLTWSDGILSGVPEYSGDSAVSLRADGSGGLPAWQNWTIHVTAASEPEPWAPHFTTAPPLTGVTLTGYTYSPECNVSVEFTVLQKPAWLAWDPVTRTLSGTPMAAGNYPVSLMALDGGRPAYQNWSVTVTGSGGGWGGGGGGGGGSWSPPPTDIGDGDQSGGWDLPDLSFLGLLGIMFLVIGIVSAFSGVPRFGVPMVLMGALLLLVGFVPW